MESAKWASLTGSSTTNSLWPLNRHQSCSISYSELGLVPSLGQRDGGKLINNLHNVKKYTAQINVMKLYHSEKGTAFKQQPDVAVPVECWKVSQSNLPAIFQFSRLSSARVSLFQMGTCWKKSKNDYTEWWHSETFLKVPAQGWGSQ